jgi:hypothetical protein
LGEISKERQQVSEALARVVAHRDKLPGELAELESTERVLARYSKGSRVMRSALTGAGKMAALARARGVTGKRLASARGSSSLSDQVLALATGKTQREIAAACKGARPNHVGAAISRHKKAGRIESEMGSFT